VGGGTCATRVMPISVFVRAIRIGYLGYNYVRYMEGAAHTRAT